MSEQSSNFGAPLWIADNQISAVAAALKSGHIAGVQKRLAGQALVQRQDLTQAHDGKTVTLWGRDGRDPVVAVAAFPNGQLSVATKGAILLPFNNGHGDGVNAALLTTSHQTYEFFGTNAKNTVPQAPAFRAPESDLGHYAIHMIGKPHDCSGLSKGPGGMH